MTAWISHIWKQWRTTMKDNNKHTINNTNYNTVLSYQQDRVSSMFSVARKFCVAQVLWKLTPDIKSDVKSLSFVSDFTYASPPKTPKWALLHSWSVLLDNKFSSSISYEMPQPAHVSYPNNICFLPQWFIMIHLMKMLL